MGKWSWISLGLATAGIVLMGGIFPVSSPMIGAGLIMLVIVCAHRAGTVSEQKRKPQERPHILNGLLTDGPGPGHRSYAVSDDWQQKLSDAHLRPVILVGAEYGTEQVLILLSDDMNRKDLRQLMEKVNWEVKRMV